MANMKEIQEEVDTTLRSKDEEKIKELALAFQYNYCSFVNQELFWESLAPISEHQVKPCSDFGKAMDKAFGTFDEFVNQFLSKSNSINGRGLTHLCYNKISCDLEIHSTNH